MSKSDQELRVDKTTSSRGGKRMEKILEQIERAMVDQSVKTFSFVQVTPTTVRFY